MDGPRWSEGGRVGGYIVQSIEAGQVALAGSGTAKPPTAFAPVDVLQSLRGLPGVTGPTAR